MIFMRRLLLAWAVICVEMLLLITLATGGHWVNDLRFFPFDRIAMVGLTASALIPASALARSRPGDASFGQAVVLALFLLWSVSVFLDGNAAGWSHSSSLADKLVMAGVYLVILVVSLVAPIVMFFVGLGTCLGLRWWWFSNKSGDVGDPA